MYEEIVKIKKLKPRGYKNLLLIFELLTHHYNDKT